MSLSLSFNVCPVEGNQASHKSAVAMTVQSLKLVFVLRSYTFCVQKVRDKKFFITCFRIVRFVQRLSAPWSQSVTDTCILCFNNASQFGTGLKQVENGHYFCMGVAMNNNLLSPNNLMSKSGGYDK